MNFIESHKLIAFMLLLFTLAAILIAFNVLFILVKGTSVSAPEIPRADISLGAGEKLNYLILGDSTSIAQGGDYGQGYVVATANELSKKYQVTYKNVGVSGAVVSDILNDQIPKVGDFNPDLVLIAAGANDVTHLTSLSDIKSDMQKVIDTLRNKNPEVKIVFTGAADMGTVIRFTWPLKQLAGLQTKRVNKVMEEVAISNNVDFAYIARETGEIFNNHPEYFAQDNFHPNNSGYAVWTKVLNPVIEKALSK